MTTPHKVPYNDREYYGNSLMIYDGRAAADSWYSMNYQIGGYTPLKDIGYNNIEKLNGINPDGQPEMKYMWIPNTENDVGE